MSSIKIECPAHILDALKETPDEFAREARILLAAKLYEIGRLSSGSRRTRRNSQAWVE